MKNQKEYKVITVPIPFSPEQNSKLPGGISLSSLETRVNQELASGFKPCGLTSYFDQSSGTMFFYQALVKES